MPMTDAPAGQPGNAVWIWLPGPSTVGSRSRVPVTHVPEARYRAGCHAPAVIPARHALPCRHAVSASPSTNTADPLRNLLVILLVMASSTLETARVIERMS